MPASRNWRYEDWDIALEALSSRLSVDEFLALHEEGAVSAEEILGAIWGYCSDKPVVADELVQLLQHHQSEAARSLSRALQDLLRAKLATDEG